jgi:hypothetical protein
LAFYIFAVGKSFVRATLDMEAVLIFICFCIYVMSCYSENKDIRERAVISRTSIYDNTSAFDVIFRGMHFKTLQHELCGAKVGNTVRLPTAMGVPMFITITNERFRDMNFPVQKGSEFTLLCGSMGEPHGRVTTQREGIQYDLKYIPLDLTTDTQFRFVIDHDRVRSQNAYCTWKYCGFDRTSEEHGRCNECSLRHFLQAAYPTAESLAVLDARVDKNKDWRTPVQGRSAIVKKKRDRSIKRAKSKQMKMKKNK